MSIELDGNVVKYYMKGLVVKYYNLHKSLHTVSFQLMAEKTLTRSEAKNPCYQ